MNITALLSVWLLCLPTIVGCYYHFTPYDDKNNQEIQWRTSHEKRKQLEHSAVQYREPISIGPFAGYYETTVASLSQELMAEQLLTYVGVERDGKYQLYDQSCPGAFSALSQLTLEQQHMLLDMHGYYGVAVFLTCIQQLPQYEHYITRLYALQKESTFLGKCWNRWIGKVPPNIEKLYKKFAYTRHKKEVSTGKPPQQPLGRQESLHLKRKIHQPVLDYDDYQIRMAINEYHDHDNGDVLVQQRCNALNEAIDSQHVVVTRTFELSNTTLEFLRTCVVDETIFARCTGDAYQQQLYSEFVSIAHDAALVHAQHGTHSFLYTITRSIGEFGYLGYAYTHAGEVVEATRLANFCHALLEFGKAIGDGLYDGACAAGRDGIATATTVCRTIATVVHDPVRTAYIAGTHVIDKVAQLAHSIEYLAEQFTVVLCDAGELVITCFTDPPLAKEVMFGGLDDMHEDMTNAAVRIAHTSSALLAAFPDACTPDNVRLGTAFITQHGMRYAASVVCSKFYAVLAQQALVYAASCAHKIGQTAGTGGKICFDLAAQTSTRIAQFAAQTGEVIKKSKYAAVTSTFFVAQRAEICKLVGWTRNMMKPCQKVAELFGGKTIIVTEDFLMHVFAAELKEFKKHCGTVIKRMSGFHHFIEDHLKDMGVALHNRRICKKTGIVLADVVCNGYTENDKTFFPSSWTKKQVLQKIGEALTKPIEDLKIEKDCIVMYGETSEGIIVKIVMNSVGKLITAFPDALRNNLKK